MATLAVLHHDEPALQSLGMADSACRHLSCRCLKHLLYEHRAVGATSVRSIGRRWSGPFISDVELLLTLALVSCYRPASQQLICGAIGIGYMQISSVIGDGLPFR